MERGCSLEREAVPLSLPVFRWSAMYPSRAVHPQVSATLIFYSNNVVTNM